MTTLFSGIIPKVDRNADQIPSNMDIVIIMFVKNEDLPSGRHSIPERIRLT